VVGRPLAEAPLRWVHAIVWRAEPATAALADLVLPRAAQAYDEVVADAPAYRDWLVAHPTFGAVAAPEAALG
jgi:hypothetical protein